MCDSYGLAMGTLFVYILIGTLWGVSGQWIFPDKLHMEFSTEINKHCGEMPYSVRDRPAFGRMYENPWLVLLRHSEDTLHFCHGTLVSNKYVLTTANCGIAVVTNANTTTQQQATEIILGEHDLSTEIDCITPRNCSPPTTRRTVEKVIVHENFTRNFWENDIALLLMNGSIQFDNSIRPICLPLVSIVDNTDDQQQTIYNTVWSKDSVPRQIWMRNVPTDVCRNQISYIFTLSAGQICARIFFDKFLDDMRGSAGSALQVDYHGRIYQYGLLSVGFHDVIGRAPYVYIDIAQYISWIHDSINVKP
ncbi:serine protease grass-like [Anopheles moucheti]|uniref:serine protease grass-like n=1 Tax=Anopheles moucheti TaxID=186751 RepID=UPI0022F0F671|nr:serine protease grass-like [Anopheles moucheti]